MKTLLVMAGGTGGHVMPALAVAQRLREEGINIVWMGTERGIEHELVPAAGFPLELIRISGLRGTGLLRKLAAPLVLLGAAWQAMRIILRTRADAILGMGGYVSGPGGVVGRLLRRPLVLHEQNSVAGTTNRLLAPLATRVLTGFMQVKGLSDFTCIGNPVREELAQIAAPEQRMRIDSEELSLLVVGGSQGARVFNQTLPALFSRLQSDLGDSCKLRILHQCGRDNRAELEADYASTGLDWRVEEFIADMATAYRETDLVICRAGAMTVAEVAAAGVAALFVPLPSAIDDHQYHNAMMLAQKGAALCYRQEAFVEGEWLGRVKALAGARRQLLEMAVRARREAHPEATAKAAQVCMEVLNA